MPTSLNTPSPVPAAPTGSPQARRDQRGQAMVELAVVLLPVLLILVGIIQFGILFGANVTLTNAAREATRAASIYVYDNTATRAANDLDRCTAALGAARQSFGFLSGAAPYFAATSPCPAASSDDHNGDGFNDAWENGDIVMSLCASVATASAPCPDPGLPTSFCTRTDASGCLIRVELSYRSDIVVPFIGPLLARDANGRLVQDATATMVAN